MLLTLHCPAGQFHLDVPTGWNTAQLRSCLAEAAGMPHLEHQELHTVHGPLPQTLTTGIWPLVPGSSVATAPHLFPAAELARHRSSSAQDVVVGVSAGPGFGQLTWLAAGQESAIAGARLRRGRCGRIRLRSTSSGLRAPARRLRMRALTTLQPVPPWWELSTGALVTHAAAVDFGGSRFVALRLAPGVASAPPPCCGPAPGGPNLPGPGSGGSELEDPALSNSGLSPGGYGRSGPLPTGAHSTSPAAKKRRAAWVRTTLMLVPSLAMLAAAWSQGSAFFAIGAVAGVGAAISSLAFGGFSASSAELTVTELAGNAAQQEVLSLIGPLVFGGAQAHERAFAAAQAMGRSARLRVWHPQATAGLWHWQHLLAGSESWHAPRAPTCHIVDLSCGPPAHLALDQVVDSEGANPGTTLPAAELWLSQFQKTLPSVDILIVVQPHQPGPQPSPSSTWWLHSTGLADITAWARAAHRRHHSDSGADQSAAGALLPDLGITAQWEHDPGLALNSWSASGDNWFVQLCGPGQSELSGLDLVSDGPHALVAGTTGSGKSALLRTWLLALCANHSPRRLQLALIDYKGTGSFGALVDFPHVVGSANNLDRELTLRAFGALSAEVLDRQRLLAHHGVTDFSQLPETLRPARLVFAVDEAAALLDQHPELSQELKLIAAQGRSLGIHLILATQRAGSAISAQVRANISLRICLRVADSADSLDVLDHPGAADLPAHAPGSALVSIGGAAPLALRAAQNRWPKSGRSTWRLLPYPLPASPPGATPNRDYCSELSGAGDLLTEEECLNRLAATMHQANDQQSTAPATQLWRPPLPDHIPLPGPTPAHPAQHTAQHPSSSAPDQTAIGLGVADLLAARKQPELRWLPAHGHLLVSGGPKSGRSSALATVALQALAAGYHVDSYGLDTELQALLPRTGSNLRADPTGLMHLIARFEQAAVSEQPYLLLIDGWTAALQDLAALPRGFWADRLEAALLLRGASRMAITTSANPGSLAQNINQRLVLRCADPTSLVFAGVPSSWPAPLVPGRAVGLGFAPSHVLTAQLYLPEAAATPPQVPPTAGRFPQLKSLPLSRATQTSEGATALGVIGPQGDPLRPDPTRSVLLVAPQGTGHSRLLHSWPQAPGSLVISKLDEQLQALTVSESELAGALSAGTPILATVSTHALVNAYSGVLATLRRSADLLVLDPLSDGGVELLDTRHLFLTSALLRGCPDLGIYRQDSRAWQVQLFGLRPP